MDIVQIEKHGAVMWIWLNRPDRLNALDQHLIARLEELFRALDDEDEVRVVVLAGRGRAFCAGFDIEWMAERTPEMVREDRSSLRAFFSTIETCAKPVICAVHGNVMGGGLILTMVADFVIAGEDAQFGVPEIKIGIFPSLHLLPRLERLVGLRMAKSMALTGIPIDAAAASGAGLINEVIDSAHLYARAQSLAEKLAWFPQHTVQAIKQAFSVHSLPNYNEWETDTAVRCWSQPERSAAMQDFLGRRKSRSE